MRKFEIRNAYFDKLCNTPGLMWLGQNTNHFAPHATVREAIIKAMSRPAEAKPWRDYRPIFIQPKRIDDGRAPFSAQALGLADDGGLRVRTAQGERVLYAGEVSVRGPTP